MEFIEDLIKDSHKAFLIALEYIFLHPGVSKNILRRQKGLKNKETLDSILNFWEYAEVITVDRKQYGEIEEWRSTITEFGEQILKNCRKHVLISSKDIEPIRKFFEKAYESGHFSDEDWDRVSEVISRWKGVGDDKKALEWIFVDLIPLMRSLRDTSYCKDEVLNYCECLQFNFSGLLRKIKLDKEGTK